MDGVLPAASTDERSQRALTEYGARMRKWRIGYGVLLAVLVVIAGVIVKIAYAHGEISHAKLSTAPSAAPSVPLGAPASSPNQVWSSDDHTAIGTPYWGGTVITYSTHAVVGRDALTGKVRWSYTRTDRTTCTAAQIGGVTIAVFRLNGNCDELTAMDSGTGERHWTRTLDKDGHPVNGTPQFAVGQDTFMVTTPQVIYAISPDGTSGDGNGGLDRWVFSQPGCTINSAVLGSAGALVSQNCANPDCGTQKFCGAGPQLLLRDPMTGENTDSSKNKGNPDQIIWNLIGNTSVPVSADDVISAVAKGGDKLTTFSAAAEDHGKVLATLPLSAAASGTAPQAAATANAELVRLDGTTYLINETGTSVLWHAATDALPTVASGGTLTAPEFVVPTSGGIALLDSRTGKAGKTFAVPAPAPGSSVYALGSGFVVAGTRTVVYS
ncbi:MAG TPA: PQQ-binding-like beta-propeller repeat protein [Jatrophihabitantaceae bacterium]|jgi:hypothetical protein|nr:PQQ-binding-like beta-propeller repeat protein [Jatrophihabitantaceae bacterium]